MNVNPAINILAEEVKYLYGWYKEDDNPKKMINKYNEKECVLNKDSKIVEKIRHLCNKINGKKKDRCGFKGDTNLSVSHVSKVYSEEEQKYNHYIIEIHGGRNGPGKWERYCRDFSRLFLMLNNDSEIDHAYLCDLDVDCADDVFTGHIT